MAENVEDRWRALLAGGGPESREVDAKSPMRMLIGVSSVGRPYFAVIVSYKPGMPDLTSAIEVIRRQRAIDGRWTLTLELQVPALTDAFVSLLSELAAKSAAVASEEAALRLFLETLAEWQELLTSRARRLSEGALRGLIAELWFGFESGGHGRTVGEVARAWAGPLGGAQDFQFLSPGQHFEVKSLRTNRNSVEINSEEQLDGGSVMLAVVTIEQVAAISEGITLPRLVASIRSSLTDGADRAEFNRRLAHLLIDLDDGWYVEQAFAVRRLQIFNVSETFPALRRSELPQAIAGTHYHIDIQYISQFLVSSTDYAHGSEGRWIDSSSTRS